MFSPPFENFILFVYVGPVRCELTKVLDTTAFLRVSYQCSLVWLLICCAICCLRFSSLRLTPYTAFGLSATLHIADYLEMVELL